MADSIEEPRPLIGSSEMAALMADAKTRSWPEAPESAAREWYATGARAAFNAGGGDGAFDDVPADWVVICFQDAAEKR